MDDTKVFRKIKSDADRQQLQDDLNKLTEWSEKWQMLINYVKCKCFIKANKRECIGIPTLQTNGQIITNDRDKANTLNNQFSSAFTQEIYPTPKLAPSVYSDIPFLEIGIDGVVKQLKNLIQNKATGHADELPTTVLKETAAEIAPIITHI